MTTARPTISVVLPCYNERGTIDPLMRRLEPVLERVVGDAYELVFVDDGSTDGTGRALDALSEAHDRVRVLHLSRNFGHQAALAAGLEATSGDAVVLMDADLQDPPELIEAFVDRWREGYEVVYAVRRSRKDAILKRIAAAMFYRSLRSMAEVETPVDAGDFCLLDRAVVNVMTAFPERNRYLRGLRAWAGFRQAAVELDRDERRYGTSKYTLRKLIQLAVSGYLGFSVMPLRLAGVLGLLGAGLGLFLGVYTVILKLSGVPAESGWASTFAAIWFVGGVQLLVLGVIGEYLGRVYDEVRRRPPYIVRRRVGFPDQAAGADTHAAPVTDE